MKRTRSIPKQFIYCALLLTALLAPMIATAQKIYSPDKVVYDISTPDAQVVSHMLDRASLLQRIYQNDSFNASVIFVIHDGAIPLFARDNAVYHELIQRARSLTHGDIIQFKLCLASAKMQGFNKTDFHDFIEVVPMADAEIIELQHNGYAYMR